MQYRTLDPHDTIQQGDQFIPAGLNPEKDHNWEDCRESVGRTVLEQKSRDTNQAWAFRRPVASEQLVEAVETAACARKDPKVERKFIAEALSKIDAGHHVERYPTGMPSLTGVYSLARELKAARN